MNTYSVGKNGGIASKTVSLTTLSILSAPITESFPVSPLSKIDWKAVLCDKDLQNRYAIDVYNRYETLSKQMTETSTDDRYEALIATNAEVAENILPKKRKRKGIVFETPDLIHARNTLKSCAIKNRMKSTSSTRANLQSVKESLEKAYSKQLDQHISTKAAQIERLQAEKQSSKA